MALSFKSSETAFDIFSEMVAPVSLFFAEHEEKSKFRQNAVIGVDHKDDGGWENVFMNIKDITPKQLAIFERRKKEISNTSFVNKKADGITRIGWF